MPFDISHSKPSIKREYPILFTLVAIYKPGNHLTFFGGSVKEFEKDENFNNINRFGIRVKVTGFI